MNEFKAYHPTVSFAYFMAVIGFSMVFMHPVCLLLSFVCSFIYSIMLGGAKAVKFNLYMLPIFFVAALINPLFNHQGITVIAYLPSQNPLTLESILYGICASAMIVTVILWFSCFNRIITSDKLMYLFGKITPVFSLIFSMVLRFVPKFKAQMRAVLRAQKGVGEGVWDEGLIKKAKNIIKMFSIMITHSLENAVDTADSMKARGYGLPNRVAYSNYNFSKKDGIMLAIILFLASYIIVGAALGQMKFIYYPSVEGVKITVKSILTFTAYLLLCVLPIITEIKEAYKWKALKSKI